MGGDSMVVWKQVPEVITLEERSRLVSRGPRILRIDSNYIRHNTHSANEPVHEGHRVKLGLDKLSSPLESTTVTDEFPFASASRCECGPTLLVGHDTKDAGHITLQEQYLDPLMTILEKNNIGRDVAGGDWVGLYLDDPKAEVQIMIDCVSLRDIGGSYPPIDVELALQECFLLEGDTVADACAHPAEI